EQVALKEIGLPVRNTGTHIGHGVETQFVANIGIACAAIEHGKLFAPAGTGDFGSSPPDLSQVIVTGVGNWRGEGLALVERVKLVFWWSMTFSENRRPPRIKSGAGFFRIML